MKVGESIVWEIGGETSISTAIVWEISFADMTMQLRLFSAVASMTSSHRLFVKNVVCFLYA